MSGQQSPQSGGAIPARSGREPITVGKIVGLYGVKGAVKIHSYTRPPEQIFRYRNWWLGAVARRREVECLEGRRQGKSLVAKLQGVDDREQAKLLLGEEVAVVKGQFSEPRPGEYYWVDLIGLEVVNLQGEHLGKVERLLETGANDVLVVIGERERLLPYGPEVVRDVDLENGRLQVDWDSEF